MDEKDLKKLSRTDLLELLIAQTEENERLRIQLEDAEKQLADRKMNFEECGSIAEASLKLNGVFVAAQNAADEYLENVRAFCETREEIFRRHEDAARISAERIIADAEKQCRLMEDESDRRCKEMLRIAEKEAEKYWDAISLRLEMKMKQSKEDENDGE